MSMILKHNQITDLENTINYSFKNKDLLHRSLTHKSYVNESLEKGLFSNERLEFLGDSVLSLVVSEFLYKNYPKLNEGIYTDIKASLVNSETLANVGRQIKLGQYITLSKGEYKRNGQNNNSILADTLEALLGAIYLDSSYYEIGKIIINLVVLPNISKIINNQTYVPSKNKLQEQLQNKYKTLPKYKVIKSYGPEHQKTFIVGVYLNLKLLAKGTGKTKKEAEEESALKALQTLNKSI